MKYLILTLLVALSACSASGTQTTPSIASHNNNVNATSWALTPQSAITKTDEEGGRTVIAQATFTYTFNQTIHGISAFCYPLPSSLTHPDHYTFYVSESDNLGQYNTDNLIGAGHVNGDESQSCFPANSTVHYPKAGGTYTLILYGVKGEGD